MDPRDWIYGFLNHIPGPIAKPLRLVADRIFSILDDGVTFAKWIKSGIGYWYNFAISFAAALVTLGVEIVDTATWLVKTFIPLRITAAINAIKQWVSPLVTAALNTAKSLVGALQKWATTQINSALSVLKSLRDWVSARINEVRNKLSKTVDIWFDRLTHPDKMVAWILAPLITALLSYVYSKRERIAEWFLRSSPAFTTWLAGVIEKVLVKIL